MSNAVLGALVANSFTFDFLLFPLAGQLMDRAGRKWAGVPALICFAISFALLALSDTSQALWVVSSLLGVSNGLTAGFLQTLGADLAPAEARSQFLGLWKGLTSSGSLLGPLVLGIISELSGGLRASAEAVALVTAAGAAWYLFVGTETLRDPRRRRKRAGWADIDAAEEPPLEKPAAAVPVSPEREGAAGLALQGDSSTCDSSRSHDNAV